VIDPSSFQSLINASLVCILFLIFLISYMLQSPVSYVRVSTRMYALIKQQSLREESLTII